MKLKVGSIVRLKEYCLKNQVGTLGVVYEEYYLDNDPGYSIIFENGEYDGFSPDEQGNIIERIGYDPKLGNYKFKNVMQLSDDFRKGLFNDAFKK